jgi:hypothetical protein
MVYILEFFGLATLLATFQKVGQIFIQSSGHTGNKAPQSKIVNLRSY